MIPLWGVGNDLSKFVCILSQYFMDSASQCVTEQSLLGANRSAAPEMTHLVPDVLQLLQLPERGAADVMSGHHLQREHPRRRQHQLPSGRQRRRSRQRAEAAAARGGRRHRRGRP